MPEALQLTTPPRQRRRQRAREVVLVANARASGVGRAATVTGARAALRRAGARVSVAVTASLEELAAALAGAERVVLLGGDGTLHAFANLPGPLPEVALLPAGRANNVAHSVGIPTALEDAARLAVHGSAHPLDVIAARAEGQAYRAVEGVSVGVLAEARTRYQAPNSAARGVAARAGLGAWSRFRPFPLALWSDGRAETRETTQLFVANLPRYAFGLQVAPGADPADGLLDVVAFGPRGGAGTLAALARLRRGTHLGRDGVSAWRAGAVRLDTGGRSHVVADSTDLGRGPVELAAVPDGLRLVRPPARRAGGRR
jgi:diacylglycerol kinase (ATP)